MRSVDVEVQQLASISVAVVRQRATAAQLSRVVPDCCGLVWNALRAQGVRVGRNVAICWDGRINLEVGVALAAPFIPQGELVRSTTPAGLVAHGTHRGPYGAMAFALIRAKTYLRSRNSLKR